MNILRLTSIRRLRTVLSATALHAALLMLLGMTAHGAWAQQAETSAECDEGAEPVVLAYSNSTQSCDIGPSGTDTDRFVFSGVANDQVRLTLATITNNLDPVVEVRDATNTVIGSNSCFSASNTRCSLRLDLTLASTGDFLIIVSDVGADNAGGYILGLEGIVPDPSVTLLAYDETLGDTVSPLTDTDFFHFEANANTSLAFTLVTRTNDLDPRVEIRDPSNTLIVNGAADGASCNSASNTRCSFRIALEPTLSGTYSLQVYDNDGFNTGDYDISLWCEFGDCGSATTPDPDGPMVYFVPTIEDTIEPLADANFRTFNATAGTSLRFRLATLTNDLDPVVAIRDPLGNVVINGSADGAACNSASNTRCSLSFDLVPAMSGRYAVQIYDNDSFNTGSYAVGLWCILGECDGDADTFIDGDREVLSYGVPVTDNAVDALADADFYEFLGTPGDEIRITVAGQTLNLDPRIEIRDPNGVLVEDGTGSTGCNSASNTVCSFAYTLEPAVAGTYSVLFYDDDSFNSGDYDITLECLFGTGPGFTCNDLPLPPFLCADNCSSVINDDQRDSNADGFGNLCDTDLNDDLVTNAVDLGLVRLAFFSADADADFDGSGVVNVVDLGLMRQAFFAPPGPSCAYPNLP